MSIVVTDSQVREALKSNVNRILRQRGMSRYRLAKITGESEQNIANLCNGRSIPGTAIIARIAEALAVAVDDLLPQKKAPKKTFEKVEAVA